uniref:Uncharacterized protein n=1 Tax=Cacopsylla melanoneura TaxID=428564 RepID=A0A8D8W162_9HEMI
MHSKEVVLYCGMHPKKAIYCGHPKKVIYCGMHPKEAVLYCGMHCTLAVHYCGMHPKEAVLFGQYKYSRTTITRSYGKLLVLPKTVHMDLNLYLYTLVTCKQVFLNAQEVPKAGYTLNDLSVRKTRQSD